jgi:N4-(beta-N-acetylglucosaminyl)-L-asparaginase
MRQGLAPAEACKKALERIVEANRRRNRPTRELQVGFLALNKKGEHGAYCLQKGFNYALYSGEVANQLLDAPNLQ